MKRTGDLWDRLTSFEHLLASYRQAARAKRYSRSALAFSENLEENLIELKQELRSATYVPGPYRTFQIYRPKPRLISAAPFRDRVVHHAICGVIEPVFERGFIENSYACRMGKGTHRAMERFHTFQRQGGYLLKCDIEKYFPSIDHAILKTLVRRKIKCRPTLALIDLVIDHSCPQIDRTLYFPGDDLFTPFERRRGLPIGNLTSQFFANVYLDPLDHFVQQGLGFIQQDLRGGCTGLRGYLRYMDDFVVFAARKDALWRTRDAIAHFLNKYRLRLNPRSTRVYSAEEGVSFLGYRLWPTHRRLSSDTVRRARRSLTSARRLVNTHREPPAHYRCRVMSFLGQAKWADAKTIASVILR